MAPQPIINNCKGTINYSGAKTKQKPAQYYIAYWRNFKLHRL